MGVYKQGTPGLKLHCHHNNSSFRIFITKVSLLTYSHLMKWRTDSGSSLTHASNKLPTWISAMSPSSSSNNALGDYIIMTLLTWKITLLTTKLGIKCSEHSRQQPVILPQTWNQTSRCINNFTTIHRMDIDRTTKRGILEKPNNKLINHYRRYQLSRRNLWTTYTHNPR